MSSGKTVTLNTGYKIPYVNLDILWTRHQELKLMVYVMAKTVNWDMAPGKLLQVRSETAFTRL